MMDMSVSGGASGAESAATAKSARPAGKDDAAGQKNGFFDALAKASGNAANDDADDAQPNQGVAADGSAEKVAQSIRGRNGAKPLIDLGDAALKAQAEAQPETIVSADKAAAKPVKAEIKMPTDLALGKLDPKDSSANGVAPAAKGGKHTKADALETDTDKASDDDDGGISDVLGLLKQEPADGTVTLPAATAHHVSATSTRLELPTKNSMVSKPRRAAMRPTLLPPSAAMSRAARRIISRFPDRRLPKPPMARHSGQPRRWPRRLDGRPHRHAIRPVRKMARRRPMSKTFRCSNRAAISA